MADTLFMNDTISRNNTSSLLDNFLNNPFGEFFRFFNGCFWWKTFFEFVTQEFRTRESGGKLDSFWNTRMIKVCSSILRVFRRCFAILKVRFCLFIIRNLLFIKTLFECSQKDDAKIFLCERIGEKITVKKSGESSSLSSWFFSFFSLS